MLFLMQICMLLLDSEEDDCDESDEDLNAEHQLKKRKIRTTEKWASDDRKGGAEHLGAEHRQLKKRKIQKMERWAGQASDCCSTNGSSSGLCPGPVKSRRR